MQPAKTVSTMLILLLALGALFVSACSDPDSTIQSQAFSAREIPGTIHVNHPIKWDIGQYGGTWYGTFSEDPKTYNLFASVDYSARVVTESIADGLFDYDVLTREWKGRLVETFRIETDTSKNTLDLFCTLRANLKWSDGVPMTSDDIVFWWNKIDGNMEFYPRGAKGQQLVMQDGSTKRITIEKIDDRSFVFHFPVIVSTPLLIVNSNEMVPRHIWEPVHAKGLEALRSFWDINTPAKNIVGSGPFMLDSYTHGERIVFKRNPHYWMKDEAGNQLPYLDSITLVFMADPNTEILKFQNGEIDSYSLRGRDYPTLLDLQKKGAPFTLWNGGPSSGYNGVIFNMNPAKISKHKFSWFTDRRFRQAISCLADRDTLVVQVASSLGEPAYHMFSSSNRFFNPDLATTYRYNHQLADQLFKEIGMLDRDGDGIREDKDGNAVQFDIFVHDREPLLQDIANILIRDFEKAGLKVNLATIDWNVYVQKIVNSFDWDCIIYGMSFPNFPEQWINVWRSNGDLHYWHPKQQSPLLDWEKTVDEIYNTLVYTYDEQQLTQKYGLFQKTLMDELVVIPLYRRYALLAVANKWGNINWDVSHEVGDGMTRVYLRK